MKVLHVLWSARFGGIERLVLDLATAESRLTNIQTQVLFGQGEGEMLDHYRAAGIPFESAGLSNAFTAPRQNREALKGLLAKPDVLHFHNFIPAITWAAAGARGRVVYTEHGNFGLGRRLRFRDHLRGWLQQRFFSARVDFMSFNSDFTRQIAETRYRLGTIERAVIHNGVDFNLRRAETDGIDAAVQARIEGKFVVGTSSRFVGFKRIDRLIGAFARFSVNREAVLLLVGDGPLRSQLYDQCVKLGVADKTIFAGYQANVVPYQNAMRVCVFPSQGEPFGLAAVETLSLGKPTIVFKDAGGMSEIVAPYCKADVVDDEDALARRLGDYYLQYRNGHESGAEARIRRADDFDIGKMAERFGEIYNRILSERYCVGASRQSAARASEDLN